MLTSDDQCEFNKITRKLVEEIENKHNAIRDKEVRTFLEKRWKKRDALQKHCSHPETYVYVDEDYHNNVYWDETYCKVCGKMLSRI